LGVDVKEKAITISNHNAVKLRTHLRRLEDNLVCQKDDGDDEHHEECWSAETMTE
jgi:hypothetical protein